MICAIIAYQLCNCSTLNMRPSTWQNTQQVFCCELLAIIMLAVLKKCYTR